MSASAQGQFHTAEERQPGEDRRAEYRFPAPVSAAVIISASMGLWYGIWKAGSYLASFLT